MYEIIFDVISTLKMIFVHFLLLGKNRNSGCHTIGVVEKNKMEELSCFMKYSKKGMIDRENRGNSREELLWKKKEN